MKVLSLKKSAKTKNKKAGYYKINAKHRYFNPMIGNQRIINQSPKFKSELNSFLGDHFDRYVKVT